MSNRLQLALSLIVVILLVFGTNRIDRYHFEKVQDITRSVYEDRLVAVGYIYEMDQIFDEKKIGLEIFRADFADTTDSIPGTDLVKQTALNSKIQSVIDNFSKTRLTPDEGAYFEKLQRTFLRLKDAETAVFEGNSERYEAASKAYRDISTYLDVLADIQQGEGKRMTEIAQESLNQNAFMSQIEIAIVILVGIVLQVVLFYKR